MPYRECERHNPVYDGFVFIVAETLEFGRTPNSAGIPGDPTVPG